MTLHNDLTFSQLFERTNINCSARRDDVNKDNFLITVCETDGYDFKVKSKTTLDCHSAQTVVDIM